MRCHEVDYRIVGDDMQMVQVELDPNETVIAEAGGMNFMEEDIVFEAKMGDGSEADSGMMGKLFSAGKRVLTGESLFMTHFTNAGQQKRQVAFAAPYPGKIIPIDMRTIAGGELFCQKDSFLCAALGTRIGIAFQRRLGAMGPGLQTCKSRMGPGAMGPGLQTCKSRIIYPHATQTATA